MNLRWIAILMGALMLTGLVGCTPGAPLARAEAGASPTPQAPISGAATAQGATADQQGAVLPASPTPVITEHDAMTATQVQTPLPQDVGESVKWAIEDLAQRLRISVDSVNLEAVIRREFTDDDFYCRTKKNRIAKEESPLTISGWSILLSALGGRYEYHASGQIVLFCRPLL